MQSERQQLFGPFLVDRLLARGGMAEILLAHERGLAGFRRRVVLKRVLPHLSDDPEFVAMFLSEARLAARLVHPSIVHVYEFGCYEGCYFLSMEYVEGASLSQVVKRIAPGRLPIEHSMKIVALVCEALQYTHTLCDEEGRPLGLVHRDVSPQNVLLSIHGSVKLADFGIAKATERPSTTRTGTVKGKFPFMAPERLLGEGTDRRSDIFSVGVLLYELLTGLRLYGADDPGQIVARILTDPVPSLLPHLRDYPPELDEIVARALAKKPEQRYQQAEQMQMDLERAMARAGMLSNAPLMAAFFRSSDVFSEARRFDEPASSLTPEIVVQGKPASGIPVEAAALFEPETTPNAPLPARVPTNARSGTLAGGSWTALPPPASLPETTSSALPRSRKAVAAATALGVLIAAVLVLSLAGRGESLTGETSSEGRFPSEHAGRPSVPMVAVRTDQRPSNESTAGSPPAPLVAPPNVQPPTLVPTTPSASAVSVEPAALRELPRAADAALVPRTQGVPDAGPSTSATGLVSLDTSPWSRVYFRGRLLGETPLAEVTLPAGLQRLVCVDGSGRQRPVLVRVQPNGIVRRRVNLEQ